MNLIDLTLRSMFNRRLTLALTVFSLALSITLLLAVEKVRGDARSSFTNTISGTDLLVGARSGSVQLLLYSVFRIGNATNNISWESYEKIRSHSTVQWAIPISLGDSHRGFRVMGTSQNYFSDYSYGAKQSLAFAKGKAFDEVFDTVIGAEVAAQLGYPLGREIVLAHGLADVEFARHDDKPFTIVGILAPTGTPVDRTIHVSLEGIEAMHVDWQSGTRSSNTISAEEALQMDLQPTQITAFMLRLKSKIKVFAMQRAVNEFREEPLLAVLPGVALQELWDLVAVGENALLIVSGFVAVVSFIGLLTGVLVSLNERRREMAILRSLGARRYQIALLLLSESLLTTLMGIILGIAMFYMLTIAAQPIAQASFGLNIPPSLPGTRDVVLLAAFLLAGLVSGALPAWRAYRNSLHDGMTPRQ
ncbi:MAG: ABC transporter permease [Pseudomonadota bacterium]